MITSSEVKKYTIVGIKMQMLDVLVLFLLIGIVGLFVEYSTIMIFITVSIAIGVPVIRKIKKEADERERKRKQAEQEEKRRIREEEIARQQHKKQQDQYYQNMLDVGERSIELFRSIPQYIKSAEENLYQAEHHFSENAFSPFWIL